MRTGIGFDFHRLVEGRELVLGGVRIPFEKGLLGHSDADVLIHAVCDAILGAAAMGDIGIHFPDTDPELRNISSLVLLRTVRRMIVANGMRVVNVDTVLLAEAPKILNYRSQIQANIALALECPPGAVGIKATTTEGCGMVGRGEGIGAMATVLLEKGPREAGGI
jgi:2-C-methyl-D-erythritol 2,4-cyclodiphosphate synthase